MSSLTRARRLSLTALAVLTLTLSACGQGAPVSSPTVIDTASSAPAPQTSSPAAATVTPTPTPSASRTATPSANPSRTPSAVPTVAAKKSRTTPTKKVRRPAPAPAGTKAPNRRADETNPLAGRTWGVYKGPQEQAWAPYERASGYEKELLSYIALAPKSKWMGQWVPPGEIRSKVQDYVRVSQAGDPNALVQIAVFAMRPWEGDACKRLPTRAEKATYRQWITNFVAGIGDAHVAIIQQPDGPFALCAPKASKVYSKMVRYGTRKMSTPPNSSVYVEVGAHDWPFAGPSQGGAAAAAQIALRGGVKYARGIALNGTHYSATPLEIKRAAEVITILESKGITGKKAIINTATSGHPFEFGDYTGPDPDNAFTCKTKTEPVAKTCVTLGIPPTADVANDRWGLSEADKDQARRYVDGYVWFGRPWLHRQNDPFVLARALDLVRSSPFSPYS